MESYKKKLIEVALPLDAINAASAREKSIRHGHPSTLHLWWARRPLAAARAVLFAQLVDDPSAHPELFPTEEDQQKERDRLFRIIEALVKWENTNNETVLNQARAEIKKSWAMTCRETGDDPEKLPAFHDPFAGGGSIPLEAQRLGLEAHASDLNPVAVLINKAMIEIPPKFANMPPVNPESRRQDTGLNVWQGAQGLAGDVRYYGKWMRDEAERRIGHLYPKVEVTPEMVRDRPDLKPYEGQELTVIAWIWARTVKSPNPAFRDVHVPLISTYVLSSKKGKEAWLKPVKNDDSFNFIICRSTPPPEAKKGTKLGRGGNFKCLLSEQPISNNYIRNEFQCKRDSKTLITVVVEGNKNRFYIEPTPDMQQISNSVKPSWKPEQDMNQDSKDLVSGRGYGFTQWHELFTDRQIAALNTFSDLIHEVRVKIYKDAYSVGLIDDKIGLSDGGNGASAYCDAIVTYLSLTISRLTNSMNNLTVWSQSREQTVNLFSRQAIPMTWDFPEVNPFSGAAGDFYLSLYNLTKSIPSFNNSPRGYSSMLDACKQKDSKDKIISTDPPYYDNISYADLSDFFYVWLRKPLKTLFPDLFSTMVVPKNDELIVSSYRHGNHDLSKKKFIKGMTETFQNLAFSANKLFPITIYYAFRQSENTNGEIVSTGWETILEAIIKAGLKIQGTWPLRTERPTGVKVNVNALASSIILVCRIRAHNSGMTTRRDFQKELREQLIISLRQLQKTSIAPVDMAQAAIGPGMAIFSSYSRVIEADGTPMKVRTALALINEVLDEILAEQEGEMDGDTRWAVAWFEQYGMGKAPYGTAETLCNAKNTSMHGLVDAGIVHSKSGKVHLLRREEMDPDWDPQKDKRLTVWEATQHLIQKLESEGEGAAAELIGKLGGVAEQARDLAYRLFQICERKKWASEAKSYNSLVISWPELTRRAQPKKPAGPEDQSLF